MAKYNAIVSRELIALPGGENTISAGRGKSVEAAKLYLENPKDNKRFIFLTQNNPDIEDPTINDVYKICSLIEIVDVVKENKFYKIKFKCLKRMLLLNLKADSIYKVEAESVKESNLDDKNIPIKINEMVKILTKESDQEQKTKLNKILASKTISEVIDKIINIITIDEYVKYKDFRKTILSELNLSERINLAFNFVQNNKTPLKDDEKIQDEKNRAAIDNEINKKVNDSLSKNQREFYLREKLKIVKDEIAKINPSESEAAGYRKRVEENPYPQNIKDKVLNEVSKLETSSNYSQENAVTKQYID
jgi:ATP-dependent Lon protease